MVSEWMDRAGIAASMALPFFNIPLIVKLVQRKRSDDFSLSWAIGVWACILVMTPKALTSPDPAFRAFGIFNIIFFSFVVFFILKYRSKSF